MSRIRGKDTKPEMAVRKFLFANGLRYRLHVKSLPGSPDIVLRKYNTVVFVNGCFWHGHEMCNRRLETKTRVDWWAAKIARNKGRDVANASKLADMGYRVIVVWECEIKQSGYLDALLGKIKKG